MFFHKLNFLIYQKTRFKYPIKNNGSCKPKLVKIALSEVSMPATDQPKAPAP